MYKLSYSRWNDSAVVTVGSNAVGVAPERSVKRWSSSEKKKIEVPMPLAVQRYNRGMGGVDLVDRAISNVRPCIHGKKWYFPLLVHAINVSVTASWRIYQYSHSRLIPQMEYVRKLVSFFLAKHQGRRERASITKDPHTAGRSGKGHGLQTSLNRLRCRVCKKQTRMECKSCKVPLHIHCFDVFHETLALRTFETF